MTTAKRDRALIRMHHSGGSAETAAILPAAPSGNAADLRLVASIDRALRATGYLELRELRISVDHGWITLRRCVRTYYLKQLAQAFAMSVTGAESVDNQIVVT